MKKMIILFALFIFVASTLHAQDPITANTIATFNAYAGAAPDSSIPYYKDLGVRRVIVADADLDGTQEIIATDYSNGGRVHVLKYDGTDNLEIIWSSPLSSTSSGSTPRFPQVGDCDGDGMPEIIFEQNGEGRIVFYEWNGVDWGTEPAYEITSDMFSIATGTTETLRLNRETLLVYDIDGDGKSEIINHTSAQRNVFVLSVDGEFPGFANLVCEGGRPDQTQNGQDYGITGSYFSSTVGDIDGDGKLEIINNHWDRGGMWGIQVNGPDSYSYPDTSLPGVYHRYSPVGNDGVSYFGMAAADVDGDGRHEIAGTFYQDLFKLVLFDFNDWDTSPNLFVDDPDSIANRFGVIATREELAALGGKTIGEFWPCVKGDLNQDGKDEIYTGGGAGINLIAVQYKGTGSLLDGNNYTKNLVYSGAGDIFRTIKIYHGRIDTLINGSDTTYQFNPALTDTVKEETPFTAYIYADSVDLDGDGKLEIVLSEQSVYDSTIINHYVWVDSTRSWELDLTASTKVINEYRKTIRVLEYDGTVGLKDEDYKIITPDDYVLENNYPNPFNPSTSIRFTLPMQKEISLKIYDMLGNEVATLINRQVMEKGNHEMTWAGINNNGVSVASGNYIATLSYGSFSKSIKMTLLK